MSEFLQQVLEKMVKTQQELSAARRERLRLQAEQVALTEDMKELTRIVLYAEQLEQVPPLNPPTLYAPTGLRTAILGVLNLGPMKAPQIARILTQQGFQNTSKTPLAVRIYNDLWRMIEPGIVVNDKGLFRLTEAE